ncbi:unnamed protein product, partial [Leptidea sinapis]
GGASCVSWAGGGGVLLSGGRRGDVLVWDLRTRAPRHKLHAHHAPVKCLALSPHEDVYAIGAADGDIKVFSLSSHQLLHTFAGEHARSSFFKHIGQGVTQIHIDNAGRMFSCGADGTMKVRKLPDREARTRAADAHHELKSLRDKSSQDPCGGDFVVCVKSIDITTHTSHRVADLLSMLLRYYRYLVQLYPQPKIFKSYVLVLGLAYTNRTTSLSYKKQVIDNIIK